MSLKTKDALEKIFLNYNDVFVSLFHGLVFTHDEIHLTPENLVDAPTEQIVVHDNATPNRRIRDVIKYYHDDFGCRIAMYGIENQTQSDASMVLRSMGYDWSSYSIQYEHRKKGEKLIPVISVVLYFGYTKRWSAARSLHELVHVPQGLTPHFQDYRIRVIEIAWLTDEEIERLDGDLRIFAIIMRKLRLHDYSNWPKTPTKHSGTMACLIAEIIGNPQLQEAIKIHENKENTEMDAIFDKYINDTFNRGLNKGIEQGFEKGIEQGIEKGIEQGIEKGIEQGFEKGIEQGIEKGRILGEINGEAKKASDVAKKLLNMHMDAAQIADITGLSLGDIEILSPDA